MLCIDFLVFLVLYHNDLYTIYFFHQFFLKKNLIIPKKKNKNSGFRLAETNINNPSPLDESYFKDSKQDVSLIKNTRSEYYSKGPRNKGTKAKNILRETFETRLYSIGEDNFLVEYNVAKSKEKLEVENFTQIENQHVPQCLIEYSDGPKDKGNKGLLIANQGIFIYFFYF